MRCTSFYMPWLIPVYSWKNPLEIITDFNEKAPSLGSPHTTASFPRWPGCRGREPPCFQLKRYPRSNRFEGALAKSRGNFHLLAVGKEEMRFPQEG
jgi:hypothetical protein